MIDKEAQVPVRCQCELAELPRSSAYYKPVGANAQELELMRRIDEIYTEFPFYATRQMRRVLWTMGWNVGRRKVRRLMRLMGLEALCPKPNLSKPAPGHKVYPYLMRNLSVERPNQAWCADITYIRLDGGFVYLIAIMDWYSRKILAWELSNSMNAGFCVKALQRALTLYDPPEIMNTDQGSQFTGDDWINVLKSHDIRISMDGRGRALDNVFVERFWRTLKYEEVYRREYAGIADAREHMGDYIETYNTRRPHSSLEDRTPARVHAETPARNAA